MMLVKIKSLAVLLGLVGFLTVFALTSCRSTPTPTSTPTPSPRPTSTPYPTSTATPQPLASEKNPLIMAIVPDSSDPKVQAALDQVANQVSQITGFTIHTQLYSSYRVLLSDLALGKVHITFLPPMTYLYARQQGSARAMLVANHLGVYGFGTRLYANAANKFTIYYDPVSDRATADENTALKQFQDKRPCWVDPGSPSGYIVPAGLLADRSILVKPGAFLASPTSVIRALYITGICDFGATFSATGDPRTSSAVQGDLTDVMNRVVIIWQSDPIIPNLNLSLSSLLKADMQDDLAFAIQSLPKDKTSKDNLSAAVNYEILDFKRITDADYDALLKMALQAKIDLTGLVGK